MAKVRAYRGWRYDPQCAGSLEDLVAPPYDVIDEAQRLEYASRSPHNIVHLTLGDAVAPEPAGDARYAGAARRLRQWMAQGILRAEAEPALYVYEQSFALEDGQPKTRRGFIGLVEVRDYAAGIVLPHEWTFPGARYDRLKLLSACRASLSDIFGLYWDPDRVADQILAEECRRAPDAETAWPPGQTHRLWVLTAPDRIGRIVACLADKQIMLADGHHRYEVALAYRDRQRKAVGRSDGPWEWVNMFLCNAAGPGVVIMPTHRLWPRPPAGALEDLAAKALRYFEVNESLFAPGTPPRVLQDHLAPRADEKQVLGVYLPAGRLLRLSLRDASVMDDLVPTGRSEVWRSLDVTVLHKLVLEHLLGLTRTRAEDELTYTARTAEALAAVEQGAAQALFLLNPLNAEEVLTVALGGERLPHKATYFYPKLLAGLVIRDHDLD